LKEMKLKVKILKNILLQSNPIMLNVLIQTLQLKS